MGLGKLRPSGAGPAQSYTGSNGRAGRRARPPDGCLSTEHTGLPPPLPPPSPLSLRTPQLSQRR